MTAEAVRTAVGGKLGPAALGAVATAAVGFASGYLNLDLPPWVIEQIKQGGSAIFILIMIAGAIVYYVPRDAVPRAVKAFEDQASAITKVGTQLEVLSGQSGKLDEIKNMLGESQLTDRVIVDRLSKIEVRLEIKDVN